MIFFPEKVPPRKPIGFLNLLSMSVGTFPFDLLESQYSPMRILIKDNEPLILKIDKRLSGWKRATLS